MGWLTESRICSNCVLLTQKGGCGFKKPDYNDTGAESCKGHKFYHEVKGAKPPRTPESDFKSTKTIMKDLFR